MTSETLPGEPVGLHTKQWTYTDWCSGTAAQTPCEEIDEIDRLDSTTTTVTRAFYDGRGSPGGDAQPGPGSQDIVTYAYYDQAERQIFKSNPYLVTAYTGLAGPAAYSIPDSSQPGTSTTYTNCARRASPIPIRIPPPRPRAWCVESLALAIRAVTGQTMVQDANGHQAAITTGGLGKVNYKQTYTGSSSSTYTLYATTALPTMRQGTCSRRNRPTGRQSPRPMMH